MHRIVPIAAVAIGAVTLSACGSSSSTSTSPSTAQAPGGSTATGSSGGATTVQTGNPGSSVTLDESGSSLLEPFLAELVAPLSAKYPNVKLAPTAGGSGKGISDAIAGNTQVGGSDAYLSPGELSSNPGLMNIPIAISSQSVDYNLKGVTNLKLSGSVIAQIYEGKITKWNASAIAALNPGVTLPSEAIVPVRRVDSSGDTFLFTSFLSKTNPDWASGPGMDTSVSWPSVTGELTADGNPAMVSTCSSTPGCIAYIGISAQSDAVTAGLGQSELQDAAGQYVLPTPATISSAVSAGAGSVPSDLVQSLIYEPGASSYPIVNFEYTIVKASQSSSDTALALRDFLTFAIDPTGGSTSALLGKEQFQALPSAVIPKVDAEIAKIQG